MLVNVQYIHGIYGGVPGSPCFTLANQIFLKKFFQKFLKFSEVFKFVSKNFLFFSEIYGFSEVFFWNFQFWKLHRLLIFSEVYNV